HGEICIGNMNINNISLRQWRNRCGCVMQEGYQTMIGEMGRGLSGGQRQRLLIARALYKNPDYLFLDEATNSLDTINEQKIVKALNQVFQNRTVIVVAHRLSTIRKADQIIVLKSGMIAEVGNHEKLMENKKYYYELIQSQYELESEKAPTREPQKGNG
ncbi:MAG: ATP-binding cassette domain-containing protein, partial [Dysgonamonadaceae bacterium]|nr:ATP-binding cassette domain-containing protein [Dysgonamonadaceae bacterium]